MTQSLFRRLLVLISAFLIAGTLTACDNEETQRKTFITFLQTRILDKKDLHVPTLTEDEKKSFGAYADHYAVIANFHGEMDATIKGPMMKAMRCGMITSVSDLVTRRKDLAVIREGVIKMKGDIDVQLAKANQAKAALSQPDDLKPVFDAVYARTVTAPAKLMSDVFPAVGDMLGAADNLAGWIEEHRNQIQVNGMMVQVSDQKLLDEYNALAAKIQVHQKGIMEAQQALNAMVRGR